MIYCPHCKKPSVQHKGACPHCGENLKGSAPAPKTKKKSVPRAAAPRAAAPIAAAPIAAAPIAAQEAQPQITKTTQQEASQNNAAPQEQAPAAQEFGTGSVNLELDTGGPAVEIEQDDSSFVGGGDTGGGSVDNGSNVDLAFAPSSEPIPDLDQPAPAPVTSSGLDLPPELPASRAEIDDLEIHEEARFGRPDSGPIGAFKYWWLVYNRLKELEEKSKKAAKSSEVADTARKEAQAELGRRGQNADLDSKTIADLISKALVAEVDFKGMQRQYNDMAKDHAAKIEPLEKKSAEIEAAAEPIRIRMDTIHGELKELSRARSQIDTKKKRIEIEIRNIDELISKRQEAYADTEKPPEERKKLLDEISEIDKRRPGVMEQLEECENQIAKMADPIANIESRLSKERRAYGDEMEKVEALKKEVLQATKLHSSASGTVSGQIDSAGEKVETAWATVGAQIVKERCSNEQLGDLPTKTVGAMRVATEAERKVLLLDRCKEAYDHDTVALAKKIAIGVCAAIVITLVVLMVVL